MFITILEIQSQYTPPPCILIPNIFLSYYTVWITIPLNRNVWFSGTIRLPAAIYLNNIPSIVRATVPKTNQVNLGVDRSDDKSRQEKRQRAREYNVPKQRKTWVINILSSVIQGSQVVQNWRMGFTGCIYIDIYV